MAVVSLVAKPLPRTSLAEAAYERLLEEILSGRLRGGTELSEVALAAKLQVSRTPVHEAVRRLAADGLVRLTALRTAYVAEFTRRDIVEIYEMRCCLESTAARQAATRMGDDELRSLQAAAEAVRNTQQRGWKAKALEFDQLFHQRIAESCGNARLHDEIKKYRHLVRALCRMSGTQTNLQDAYEEHLVILRALMARSGEEAAAAMTRHISARLNAVLRELSDDADTSH